MEKYIFHNERYGIKVELTLDGIKKELTYQCNGIKDEYKGNFRYECKNGWKIRSNSGLAMNHSAKIMFLRGDDAIYDHSLIVINERKYHNYRILAGDYIYTVHKTYKNLQEIYYQLIDAFEELGNDSSIAKAMLDM